jgi:tetraacyldisaccharide 4'-kinase
MANDEERLVRRHIPAVIYVADGDRIRGARTAVSRDGANAIVLDDGFQHRRLHRDLDVVVIDALCPFGYGHLLPRGLLREPLGGLRRADAVVLTRYDQAGPQDRAALESRIQSLAPEAIQLKCRHRVTAVENLTGTPLPGPWAGRSAGLFAGIGNPDAFVKTVQSLGVTIVGTRWWPDHHRYGPKDLEALRPLADKAEGRLLTTEKDAVKLNEQWLKGVAEVHVVKVAIEWLEDGQRALEELLRQKLTPRDT